MTNQRNMHGSCHAAFFTSCLLVVTASCSGNQEKDSPFINFDYALNVPLDSVIESVDVIPLEIKNEHYPYGIPLFQCRLKMNLLQTVFCILIVNFSGIYACDLRNFY